MKLMVIPNGLEGIKLSKDYVDAYLIGIKDMCVNSGFSVCVEEIGKIKEIIGNKELFINLNKNMFNDDLDILKDILIKLNDYDIKGLFYYDVAVVSLYNKISANYDLVWASEHATTNYHTINYWKKFGVNYSMLSMDITANEIMEIRKNTDVKLIVPIFGYQSMFVSKRHIVKNYLEYFKLSDDSKVNYMEKEGKVYPIIDNNLGTEVYTNNILNGFKEYNNFKDNKIDYCLLNSFNIDDDKFIKVLKIINNFNENSFEEINEMFDNIDTGFLYRETIAKVKKNDK